MRLQYVDTNKIHEGFNTIIWRTNKGQCGVFDVHIKDKNAHIVGYSFKHERYKGKGDGYKMVKQSIQLYLDNGYNVISRNSGRNQYSDRMWVKLSKDYIVQDIISLKYKCKIIMCDNKRFYLI